MNNLSPLTREQLITINAPSVSYGVAPCPTCGVDLARGGIAWGSCRGCHDDVCEHCAAIYFSDETPVFVCRGCVEPPFVYVHTFVPSNNGDTVFAHCGGVGSGHPRIPCFKCFGEDATLSPCLPSAGDETGYYLDPDGAALCERCSERLPLLPRSIRSAWPEVTDEQVVKLWSDAWVARGAELRKVAARLRRVA